MSYEHCHKHDAEATNGCEVCHQEMLAERERAEALVTGPVTPAEARQILSRFNASHWNNPGEHARYSIPADAKRDDDIRMAAFITQSEQRLAVLEEALRKIVELSADRERFVMLGPRGFVACEQIAKAALEAVTVPGPTPEPAPVAVRRGAE